jgi:hypothetical protein
MFKNYALLRNGATQQPKQASKKCTKSSLGFLVQCVEALPDHLHVQPVTCHGNVMMRRLEVEADEMASFVQKKANKQWIWIAMDATTRQVMAFHVGAYVST